MSDNQVTSQAQSTEPLEEQQGSQEQANYVPPLRKTVVTPRAIETPAQVVSDTRSSTVAPLSAFEQTKERFLTRGGDKTKSLIAFLDEYVEFMKPGNIVDDRKEGLAYQKRLWKAIRSVVETEDHSVFRINWNALLLYFSKYKDGALGATYVFRSTPHWNTDKTDLDGFHQTLNILLVSVSVKVEGGRYDHIRGTVDIESSIRGVYSNEYGNNILKFYSM